MPRPSAGDVHVNGVLSNLAVKYAQDETSFISTQVFPTVPVVFKSDIYPVYLKEDIMRDEAKERAPGAESEGGDYEIDLTNTYNCRNFAFHKDVDDDTRANSQPPMNPEKDAMQFCMQKMLIKRERMFASKFMTGSVWGNTYQGVSGSPSTNEFKQWDASGSTILKNVEDWKELISGVTGRDPNVMVIAANVMPTLKTAAEIKDQIKYTQRGIVTTDILASLFGVERVLVPKAIYNSAAKGATASYSRIMSKKILLCYAEKEPSLEKPSAGYNFAWTGRFGNSAIGSRIKKFRVETRSSDRIEAEMSFDFKIVAPDLGFYAYDVVS